MNQKNNCGVCRKFIESHRKYCSKSCYQKVFQSNKKHETAKLMILTLFDLGRISFMIFGAAILTLIAAVISPVFFWLLVGILFLMIMHQLFMKGL